MNSLTLFAGCVPIVIILAAVYFQRWQRKRKGERSPLTEKLLRPPGYSLQLKLEDLNDSFMIWFLGAFLFSALVAIFPQTRPVDVIAPIVSVMVFGPITVVCTIVALRKLWQIHNYRCGLLGEQAVAEELQSLVRQGYEIFHDLPCENGGRKWNIDHIAVGPGGVFAIETKYRTKKPGKNGERDNKAMFVNGQIQFPTGYDVDALQQAESNGRWLANMLSKAVGERVAVQPIVALPGWWVELKDKSDVKVLSGKQISGYIAKEPARISDKAIKQISYQLEQRCRNVEL